MGGPLLVWYLPPCPDCPEREASSMDACGEGLGGEARDREGVESLPVHHDHSWTAVFACMHAKQAASLLLLFFWSILCAPLLRAPLYKAWCIHACLGNFCSHQTSLFLSLCTSRLFCTRGSVQAWSVHESLKWGACWKMGAGGGRGGFRVAVRQAWRKRHTWIPRLASLGMLALSQRCYQNKRERERGRCWWLTDECDRWQNMMEIFISSWKGAHDRSKGRPKAAVLRASA